MLVFTLILDSQKYSVHQFLLYFDLVQVGYYSKTDLQMGGGEAPVYSKPGEGSSKLYLFYYKVRAV